MDILGEIMDSMEKISKRPGEEGRDDDPGKRRKREEEQKPEEKPDISQQPRSRNWDENPFARRQQQRQQAAQGPPDFQQSSTQPPPGIVPRDFNQDPFRRNRSPPQQGSFKDPQPPPGVSRRDFGQDPFFRIQPGGSQQYRRDDRGGPRKNDGGPRVKEEGNYGSQSRSGSPTQEIIVKMNSLAIRSSTETVRRYHVTMTKIRNNDKEQDVTRTPKLDQALILKEQFVFSVMKRLYELNPDDFGSDRYKNAYDGGYTLYSVGCNIEGKKEWRYTKEQLKNLNFSKDVFIYLKTFKEFVITVEYTGNIIIGGPLFNPKEHNREKNKVFDVLTSAYMREGDTLNYGQKSYAKEEGDSISDGKEIKRGLEKTIKAIGDEQLVLQAQANASTFDKCQSVLDHIRELLEDCGLAKRNNERKIMTIDETAKFLSRDPKDIKNEINIINNDMKYMMLRCTHNDRIINLTEIVMNNALNTKFANAQGTEMSVFDYFKATYNLPLKYPKIPLVLERFPNKINFYPLEVLEILPGHRIGISKLRDGEQVHRRARANPSEKLQQMMTALERYKLMRNQSPYLKAFNVLIEDRFVEQNARVYQAPDRVIGGNQIIRRGGRLEGRFLRPARVEPNRPIVIQIFDKCANAQIIDEFWNKTLRMAQEKGLLLPKKIRVEDRYSEIDLTELFEKSQKESVALLIFITKDKKPEIKNKIKYLELNYNVLTQCFCERTIKEAKKDTLDNILKKMNVKLGGLNTSIKTPDNEPKLKDIFTDRMFIGLELSHPAAQTFAERQLEIKLTQPTVVGMCYSTNTVEAINGRFWFQKSRDTSISGLQKYLKQAIQIKQKLSKGMLAPELVVFRMGSSDNEDDKIRVEIENIRAGCKEMNYSPSLVCMLCITGSGTIAYPQNMPNSKSARDTNVLAGTSLQFSNDTEVPEFYIKSQESQIGTSQMLRVRVLVNDRNVPLEELRKLTHWTCFAHQASQQSTRYPHVLYGASELANRGQYYYKQDQLRVAKELNDFNQEEGKRFGQNQDESDAVFWSRISDQCRPPFDHHFWC